jgi:ribokinase
MKPRIVVVGSSNTDMIMKLPHLPKPGETVIHGTFSTAGGGKGANQAVAAARAGGAVSFVAKVGSDVNGRQASESFKREGIDTGFVLVDPVSPSGVAFILVDERGENSIGVASGANAQLHPSDLAEAVDLISSAHVLLVQLEIPLPTVEAAIRCANEAGVAVILNPAPAVELGDELLSRVSILTPNEAEAEILTGIPLTVDHSFEAAANMLISKGVDSVVFTLGARGAFLAQRGIHELLPAFPVSTVDTTAAGDVFNGALAVAIGEGFNVREAINFAQAAAALSVQKLGAQPSAPERKEILELISQRTPAT